MENNASRWILVSMIMACAASADTITAEDVANNDGERLNRIGVSYAPGFNIKGKFKNVGGYTATSNPGPATAGVDHFYDDGYNRVDVTGNAGNRTTFWGFDNDSQHVGDTIVMSSASAAASGSLKGRDGDPQHGAEITYNRELGRIGKSKWGLQGAFAFTDVTLHQNGTAFGSATRVSDAYAIPASVPAIVIPPAPHRGTDGSSPGTEPVLSDIPMRTTTVLANGARVDGRRDFEADIYALKLGPYLEIPLSERFALSLSGGLSLLYVNSEFSFAETVTVPGAAPQVRKGSGSHSDFMLGGYFGGNLLFALTDNVNLSAGAQFQSAGTYTHKENGKSVELDLSQSVFLSLGVGVSF